MLIHSTAFYIDNIYNLKNDLLWDNDYFTVRKININEKGDDFKEEYLTVKSLLFKSLRRYYPNQVMGRNSIVSSQPFSSPF